MRKSFYFDEDKHSYHSDAFCCLFSFGNSDIFGLNSTLFVERSGSHIFLMTYGSNSIYSEWSHGTYGDNTLIPREIKMNESVNFSLVLDISESGEATNVKRTNLQWI